MAYFAQLDEHNNVIGVHKVNNEVIQVNGIESEEAGIEFLTNLLDHPFWKQTSYNNSFRKRYAGVGMVYDLDRDVFYPKKSHPSWVFNEEQCLWVAPVEMPLDGKLYIWDETSVSWTEVPL
jgi:hypothetical protein